MSRAISRADRASRSPSSRSSDVRDESFIAAPSEHDHVRDVLIGCDCGGDFTGFNVHDQQSLVPFSRDDDFIPAQPFDAVRSSILAEVDRLKLFLPDDINDSQRTARRLLGAVVRDNCDFAVRRNRDFVRTGAGWNRRHRRLRRDVNERDCVVGFI